MADGWATFGKGIFICIAVAGGIWLGRGGTLPQLSLSAQQEGMPLLTPPYGVTPYGATPYGVVPAEMLGQPQTVGSQPRPFAYSPAGDLRNPGNFLPPPSTSGPPPAPLPTGPFPVTGAVPYRQSLPQSDVAPQEIAQAEYTPVGLLPAMMGQTAVPHAGTTLKVTQVIDTNAKLQWNPNHDIWLSEGTPTLHIDIAGSAGDVSLMRINPAGGNPIVLGSLHTGAIGNNFILFDKLFPQAIRPSLSG